MKVIRKLMFFIAVVLVQVLVCNNIHLFDYAMPMIYVYFLMMFRRDYPRWGILLWCFALGITLDAFSNTPVWHRHRQPLSDCCSLSSLHRSYSAIASMIWIPTCIQWDSASSPSTH